MPKIRNEYINSLYLDANQYKEIMALASLDKFKNVEWFTLHNLEKLSQISDMKRCFPNLINFRTLFDNNVDFHRLCKIFNLMPNSIQRFEVHCGSISCSHDQLSLLFMKTDFNTSIKSVKFNIGYVSSSLMNNCKQYFPKCILKTIADFVKIMPKIENITIIVHKGNVRTFLDLNIWNDLVNYCNELKNITLKMMESTFEDKKLLEKTQQIKDVLENIRPTIQFQVKVK